MHLDKLIVNGFQRNTTIEQELLKYRLLNIFYNQENEIKFLEKLQNEELNMITNEKKPYEILRITCPKDESTFHLPFL